MNAASGLVGLQNSAALSLKPRNVRRGPNRDWLIGAAFVPLMLLAGVVILVETKKGRLES